MDRTTICVRSFNRPDQLTEAVESCLRQTRSCQILIVDDGSGPDTQLTIKRLLTRSSSVSVVHFEFNLGPSAALMAGIDHCVTEYLGFLDSDDLLDERFVERMETALEENSWAQAAYCRFISGPRWGISGRNIYRAVLRQGHLSALGTLVVRRAVLKSLPRLPTRVEIGELSDACDDDRLSFELSRTGGVVHVPEELYHYRVMADTRLTSNRARVLNAWKRFYADYSSDYWHEVGGYWLGWRLGNLLVAFGEPRPVKFLWDARADYGLGPRPGILIFSVGFLFASATRLARAWARRGRRRAQLGTVAAQRALGSLARWAGRFG